MACVGASAATALALAWATTTSPSKPCGATSPAPDYVLEYSGFWQVAMGEANSRVYGGIHFRFDNEASQVACPKVAGFVYANYMQPR